LAPTSPAHWEWGSTPHLGEIGRKFVEQPPGQGHERGEPHGPGQDRQVAAAGGMGLLQRRKEPFQVRGDLVLAGLEHAVGQAGLEDEGGPGRRAGAVGLAAVLQKAEELRPARDVGGIEGGQQRLGGVAQAAQPA